MRKTVSAWGPLCHAPAVAVTSNDIARRLQISQSTVSRALRGDPRVAPETRARVLKAAREMNYTPNLAARSLITRTTGTVGVVVADIMNPFYPELLDSLHNELALAGFRTILVNEQTDASVEQHVGELVNGNAVDGLVYASATLGTPLPGARRPRRADRPRKPLCRLGRRRYSGVRQPPVRIAPPRRTDAW